MPASTPGKSIAPALPAIPADKRRDWRSVGAARALSDSPAPAIRVEAHPSFRVAMPTPLILALALAHALSLREDLFRVRQLLSADARPSSDSGRD